ncbi:hypothetical protein NHG23_01000 [Aerococcaceae bacterium NML190073]|nr:hypothetical protein [Aerococcaceae bacterium NML190073]MCW6680083.1 hypothetical protein [Aerococcaceae bacterium NML130460]
MRKGLVYSLVAALSLGAVPSVFAQKVDLTPLPKVEWGTASNDSASSIGSQMTTSESSVSESTIGEASVTSSIAVDITQPASLVQALRREQRLSTDATLLNLVDEAAAAQTRSYFRDGDHHYVRTGTPSSSVLLHTMSDNKIEQIFFSVDDVMSYAAELMSLRPAEYADTAIDNFNQTITADASPFVGKYVKSTQNVVPYQSMLDEMRTQDAFLLDVIEQWLATNPTPTSEVDEVLQFDITDAEKDAFTQIVRNVEAKYPSLKPLYDMFADGYVGTIKLDFAKKEIGIGLVSEQAALECYVSVSTIEVNLPEEAAILTEAEFTELAGVNLFDGLVAPQETPQESTESTEE